MSVSNKVILEPEECLEIIRKKLCLDSMENVPFTYELVPREEFSGFLGQYFDLKINLNKKSEKILRLNFFVKLLPSLGVQRNFVEEGACFRTECSLYTKIFPKILTTKEKNFIPKCFLGLENYALVLEDMSSEGYIMLDKFEYLQLEHTTIIMKSLAGFHARSLIFEKEKEKTISELCHEENIPMNKCDFTFQSALDHFSENLNYMVDLIPQMNGNKRGEFKYKITKIASQHYKKTSPILERTNVLCHSDLWTNNILFKNGENGRIERCCLIDFQMARFCSPVIDLLYFLYCTTSREFRKREFENLNRIYYETLTASLKEAELNILKIFPWDSFQKSISEMKLSCMVHAFATMSVSFLGMEASVKRTEELSPIAEIIYNEFTTVERYRERMIDNLLDLCHNLSD